MTRRWVRLLLAVLWVAGAGLVAGLTQPLGPTTTAGVIAWMTGAGSVGLVAGVLASSGWVLLLSPMVFVGVFEVARSGVEVSSVGPLHLDGAFGLVAFTLGRLIPWLLACLPLAIGSAWGLQRGGRRSRPLGLLVSTVVVALLAGSVLLPSGSPNLSFEGGPAKGSVSELVEVELGGHDQWLQVRGASADLPVLLYLSGGPGQSDLPYSRVLLEPLTRDFLVVGWDQRGTGKSYPSLDAPTLTLDRAVADVVELARLLGDRYGQEKVYLLGESWGSLLGVLAVQEAPELFHAFLASGQMVDPRATDEAIYRDLMTAAMGQGDGDLVAELVRMGPPPYPSPLDYGTVMSLYPMLEGSYTPPEAYLQRGQSAGLGPWGILGQEYAPMDKLNVLRGLLDMFGILYPQLQGVDLRRDAPTLAVPVYLLSGAHELAARVDPAKEWFDQLEAPAKRWYTLPNSGHSVAFEHADELHRILLEDVAPRGS